MPKMNGFQITECIRNSKLPHIKDIPVVAVTADLSVTDKENCEKAGVTDYILKPYNADELQQKLQGLISGTNNPMVKKIPKTIPAMKNRPLAN